MSLSPGSFRPLGYLFYSQIHYCHSSKYHKIPHACVAQPSVLKNCPHTQASGSALHSMTPSSPALPQKCSHFSCLELRSLPSWINETTMLCLHISHSQKAKQGSPHEFPFLMDCSLALSGDQCQKKKKNYFVCLFNVMFAYIGRARLGLDYSIIVRIISLMQLLI